MISKWFIANRPSLLVGGSLVGVLAFGAVSYHAGLKSARIIDKYNSDPDLSQNEKAKGFIKDAWPYLLPAALIGIADCGMIIGAHNELVKKAGIATALAAAASTTTADLKKQMREDLGETASEKIERKVVEKQIAREGPPTSAQVTGHGETLVRNMIGGRDFYACSAHIQYAMQMASIKCREDGGFVSVNDFFNYLGIDWVDMGTLVGWREEDFYNDQIPVKITSIVGDNYEPILAISSDKLIMNRY